MLKSSFDDCIFKISLLNVQDIKKQIDTTK